ncbi:MAG TPA: hypothetical protein EYG68_07950 [Leucothrix mucor]|nr:hypothetical protein [Leucothrix mucor]
MSKQLKLGFILAIALQAFILVWMLISANLPLWFGQEIKVHTRPVDPRSLFRGNYAHLDYPLERMRMSKEQPLYKKSLRKGEVIYLSLKQDKKGIYGANILSLSPPENEVYLQGRVLRAYHTENTSNIRLKFANINAFFAPKEKALALETQLRNGAVAVLMVSDSGKAILKTVAGNSASAN